MTAESKGSAGGAPAEGNAAGHRARVGVECPLCQWRQFLEINFDQTQMDAKSNQEIVRQLQEWLRSRCPDHLGPFLEMSKN